MNTYTFTIPLAEFDAAVLPAGAPPKGSPDFGAAVHAYLQRQLEGFKGQARILVNGDTASVEWTPIGNEDPVDAALVRLQAGDYAGGVTLLEFVMRERASNPTVLYNLGMAYSDTGRLADAEKVLSTLLSVEPGMTDARVALGVAYLRMNRLDDAIRELRQAVADGLENPWAHRNLGAALLKMGDARAAVVHLERAASLNPQDQSAHFGLGEAYRALGQLQDADQAYAEAIRLNDRNEIAEQAKRGRSTIAEENFKTGGSTAPRTDAVMYCLAALEKFQAMTEDELKPLILEIAMLGTKGLDVHDSSSKYKLRALPGTFSGLQLVSYLYVGFKRIAPEHDCGFDLAKEYEVASKMHQARQQN